jgi:hypothetical protein
MEIAQQVFYRPKGHVIHAALLKGLGWGLTGGLLGTLIMDLILMAGLSIAKLSAFTCFAIVGDTVGRFLSNRGVEVSGGIETGVAAHYLLGPVIGGIFGIAMTHIRAIRIASPKKRILLAVVYVQIVSQPILATTPILLGMTTPQMLQWFGISMVMHLIYGLALGIFTNYEDRKMGTK